MLRKSIQVASVLLLLAAQPVDAGQTTIAGPPGSVVFGTSVTVLPNGNIVVTDPNGPTSNVGAVHLYGPTGVLISTITGSSIDDHIGNGEVKVVGNGNYVIRSPEWNNGSAANAGAVTWCSGVTGCSGVVSPLNSLVGSKTNDYVGNVGITVLSDGDYVVRSTIWTDGVFTSAGAVTWASGNSGRAGTVSVSNSLIGARNFDQIGSGGVTALSNGNYVVISPSKRTAGSAVIGAVTWGDGSVGSTGTVSISNSLFGSTADDQVGSGGVTALTNGNYVVSSPLWDDVVASKQDAGAATWGNGSGGISGVVSESNSLFGGISASFDRASDGGVFALSNGNYVVASPRYAIPGAGAGAGAVTWANGSTGLSGVITAANSLTGDYPSMLSIDAVGLGGVTALSNGNYVVKSPSWNSRAGAATWGNGSTGTTGVVSATNSLIGSVDYDNVGRDVTALSNGHYVVVSREWNNGAIANVGAVTWGNGVTGSSGAVSAGNSLIGTHTDDFVGYIDATRPNGVTALSNGNYVVASPNWNTDTETDVGAATWRSGSTGNGGIVTPANSVIGNIPGDFIGNRGVVALSNGHYVIVSTLWDFYGRRVGAVTWGNGNTGTTGDSYNNSLIGEIDGDSVGSGGVTALSNGNYVVFNPLWNYTINHMSACTDSGAVTLMRGSDVFDGYVSSVNSAVTFPNLGGPSLVFGYDAAREQLAVGDRLSNYLILFTLPPIAVFANGFE